MTDMTDFSGPPAPVIYPEGFTRALGKDKNGCAAGTEKARDVELVPVSPPPPPPPPASSSSIVPPLTVPQYYCGCGPWRPRQLQKLRDGRVFTLLLCLFSTVEGALVSGFTSVVLSSLERRYALPSTATGAIASTFDVAVLVSVVFISYCSGRGHKPRWLGVSAIVMATGSFVFALPQFVFGRYQAGSSAALELEACLTAEDFSPDCSSGNNFALAFFILGNILIGVGAAPLFTVGTSYLDEIVPPNQVSLHLGVFYMLAVVGPALGYALGGAFLSIYVDPWEETHLRSSDPGWVGAWWLCFIFCGVTSLLLAVPFFMFPRLLPNNAAIKELRLKEMAKHSHGQLEESDRGSIWAVLRAFFLHVGQVASTLSWLFITIAICISFVVVSGFASFGPKYVESQFGLSSSIASIAVGAVAIPTGGAGVVVGGIIIYLLKVKGDRVVLMNFIVSALTILPLLGLLVHCPTLELTGVNIPYPDGSTGAPDTSSLNSTCTSSCNCSSSSFEPVCGADGFLYFSPCRAGCDRLGTGQNAVLENCTCVADQISSSSSSSYLYSDLLYSNSSAHTGLCDRDCGWRLGLFLVLIGIGLFLIFMLQIPNVVITIRCVAEEQRTLALGLQSFMFRLFGSIPGPLLFGVIIDSACIFWQRDCGRQGSCWLYDNTALSTRAVILAVLASTGNTFFSFLCWMVYPRRSLGEEREEMENGQQKEGDERESTSRGGEGEGEVDNVSSSENEEEEGQSVFASLQTYNSRSELLACSDGQIPFEAPTSTTL